MTTTLRHPDGLVHVIDFPDGRKKLAVAITTNTLFSPRLDCVTSYPLPLIELILKVKGPAYLCDEILREEDPGYVRADLERDLFAYVDPQAYDGKRVLDFGCGSGASTLVLARMFPHSEIVGIELFEDLLSVARKRVETFGLSQVQLFKSPSALGIPDQLGGFDAIILSAVYEHLLPDERQIIMPLLWKSLKPDGILFLNLTPHRYFPFEHHTTGFPLINYLPDRVTLEIVRHFSRRADRTTSWETLLRRGIRGGTEQEILGILSKAGTGEPSLLEPSRNGLRDRIDLWFSALAPGRYRAFKLTIRGLLKLFKQASGIILVPNLSLAIRKLPD